MDAKAKECPSCKQQIQADASFCPYCGARFTVSYQGYCPNCHTIRDLDWSNHCGTCGGEVIDPHPLSQYLGGSHPAGSPAPVPNSLVTEIGAAGAPAGNKAQAAKKPRSAGCLGCARVGLLLILLGLGLLLAAYYLSDDFRNQVRQLGKSDSIAPVATQAALAEDTQVPPVDEPAETSTPRPTRTPDIDLPVIADNAACVGEYYDGLTCLEDSGWVSVPSQQIPYTGRLGDIAACPGEVFLLASDNLYGFAGGKWTHYGQYGGSVSGVIACGTQDDLWIFDTKATYHRVGGVWTEYVYETVLNGLGYLSIKGVAVTPDQQVWAAGGENVVHFDGTAWTTFENVKDLNTDYTLTGIAVDSQGVPWVSFLDGLATYNGTAWTKVAPPASTDVNTVYIDPADQVWVGTDGGVSMYKDGGWQRYPVGKQAGGVTTLAMDGQQRLWVGTDWGLGVLEKGSYTFYHMSDSDLLMNAIEHLIVLGSGPALPARVEKAPGSLQGRLVNGETPLANARVEVCVQELSMFFYGATPCSDQPYMVAATSDAGGNFSFAELPPGNYVVTFQGPDGKWKVRSNSIGVGSVFLTVRSGDVTNLGNLDISQ